MSSTYKTIKGLTYGMSSCISECGATKSRKQILHFPFFLMGGCGENEAVISFNNEREVLVAPKNMNYQWFNLLANKLAAYPYYDWDWESFSKNILKPKKEIKLDKKNRYYDLVNNTINGIDAISNDSTVMYEGGGKNK